MGIRPSRESDWDIAFTLRNITPHVILILASATGSRAIARPSGPVSEYEKQVGSIEGRPYFVRVAVRPNFDDVEEFTVVLYFADPEAEEHVQIARIDTSHGVTHLDKLYAERKGSEPMDVDVWEAHAHLESNWRRYARMHRRNHER